MNHHRFDLIVFDWDGTLFDSTALIVRAIQESARDVGVGVPTREQASYVIGLGLKDALQHAVPDLPVQRYPELAARYRHHYLQAEHELSLFDGVEALLQELKQQHYLLAVATGKSRVGLNRALDNAALRGVFDVTRTADETQSKPHPQMLDEIVAYVGVDKPRTLMVGDTTHDMQLARNAGTHAAAVAYGAHDPAPLLALDPLVCAHSVAELRDWLRQHG
ncbi:MAG: HAD-IA family hydrolase [Betaproteobacteria bacterium]|nr:HAD-IA family hydrolase [Betaproteobacteria bacterium]